MFVGPVKMELPAQDSTSTDDADVPAGSMVLGPEFRADLLAEQTPGQPELVRKFDRYMQRLRQVEDQDSVPGDPLAVRRG